MEATNRYIPIEDSKIKYDQDSKEVYLLDSIERQYDINSIASSVEKFMRECVTNSREHYQNFDYATFCVSVKFLANLEFAKRVSEDKKYHATAEDIKKAILHDYVLITVSTYYLSKPEKSISFIANFNEFVQEMVKKGYGLDVKHWNYCRDYDDVIDFASASAVMPRKAKRADDNYILWKGSEYITLKILIPNSRKIEKKYFDFETGEVSSGIEIAKRRVLTKQ